MTAKILRTTAIAAAAAASMLTVAGPAHAEAFHYSKESVTWTPWSNPNNPGSAYAWNWTINAGTTVRMECWTTGVVRLNTGKWFKVASQAYPFPEGYVPANAVSNQWLSSPHC